MFLWLIDATEHLNNFNGDKVLWDVTGCRVVNCYDVSKESGPINQRFALGLTNPKVSNCQRTIVMTSEITRDLTSAIFCNAFEVSDFQFCVSDNI